MYVNSIPLILSQRGHHHNVLARLVHQEYFTKCCSPYISASLIVVAGRKCISYIYDAVYSHHIFTELYMLILAVNIFMRNYIYINVCMLLLR